MMALTTQKKKKPGCEKGGGINPAVGKAMQVAQQIVTSLETPRSRRFHHVVKV
jgi:hypothetical protein